MNYLPLKWQTLIQNNAPFQTRLEQARFDTYMEEAKKKFSNFEW